MNLFPQIDMKDVFPVIGLAAIAIVVLVALLARTLFHSRLAVAIVVVIGLIIAGPMIGNVAVSIVNTAAVVFIIGAGALVAMLLIIRSHPDLLAMAREALSLLPQKTQPPQVPYIPPAISSPRENSITIVDAPPQPRRVTRRNSGGDEWGF
jgi:hypothetical protein